MKYSISLLRRAQNELANLPRESYERVRDSIAELAENPRPPDSRKLTGREGWRIRAGDYRVIYEINDKEQSVLVLHLKLTHQLGASGARVETLLNSKEGRQTMRVNDIPEMAQLSTPEKILLVEDLWDSIASDEASVPVPQSHIEELDRRLKSCESQPGNLLSLEELQRRVERRE